MSTDQMLKRHYGMAQRLYDWANFQWDIKEYPFGQNRPRNPLVSEAQGVRIKALLRRYQVKWQNRVYELWSSQESQ